MKTKNGNDPKSILDSLQTPSTSFEERKSSKPLPGVTKDDPKDVRRKRAEKAKDEGRSNKITGAKL